ncbi:uncharacterized protein LOC117314927 isoform X1 [Pecten maximus]|uniref:uncharacterized protein LOC117314927 isoform X1 n=1 Tax=Pecten maximus TaxID=6579 RepID=UPI001458B2F7|nr:uncharacterized protein LOC117314927 isoform X1 [Pecten maximus]
MGKVVIEKQPGIGGHLASPVLLGSQGKEIRKIYIKTSSDKTTCNARGILYLAGNRFVVSDSNNQKLKLFTDTGECLDELTTEGYPCDVCLVSNHLFAAAVYSPGKVCVVKVKASKMSLSSEIDMPNGINCYGVTYTDGMFIVGDGRGEVYRITLDGAAVLLHKYQATCYSLTQNPSRNDTIVSVCSATEGAVALSRLSAVKRHTNVMKVGVVRSAMGVDVDREGNVYICGRDSHNVVQMSGDGRRVKKLLTSSDGIDRPWAISVHDDKFLVTTFCCDYIRVFRLY